MRHDRFTPSNGRKIRVQKQKPRRDLARAEYEPMLSPSGRILPW